MSKTIKCDKCKEVICTDVQSEYGQNFYTFKIEVEHRAGIFNKRGIQEFKVNDIDLCQKCGEELVLTLKEKLPKEIYKGLN